MSLVMINGPQLGYYLRIEEFNCTVSAEYSDSLSLSIENYRKKNSKKHVQIRGNQTIIS